MQPPLPEVPKAALKAEGKQPFFGLNVVFAVSVVFHLISIVLFCFFPASNAEMSILASQLTTGLTTMISFAIDFYLWRGYNWARWLTIIGGVLMIVLLFVPTEPQSTLPEIERIFNFISYSWWAGVSVWLLLPNVAQHFKDPLGKPVS